MLIAVRPANTSLVTQREAREVIQILPRNPSSFTETDERRFVGHERKASVRRDIERARNGTLPPSAILRIGSRQIGGEPKLATLSAARCFADTLKYRFRQPVLGRRWHSHIKMQPLKPPIRKD